MSTTKDPVAVAREILEGRGGSPYEGLLDALKDAIKEGLTDFEYNGMSYEVSDFLDEAKIEVLDLKTGGEDVPAADVSAATKGKTAKKSKTKPSDADDDDVKDAAKLKGQAQKEGVRLDTDSIISELSSEESEDMVALFGGEGLTEEFKNKARTIFEVAVKARVKDIAGKLEEEANYRVDELVESNKEDLTTSLDDYLSYVVEEWVKENQVALDRGIKSDIAESFMMGLKSLFEAHYIDMPDEKYDVVLNLEDKVSELRGNLDEEITRNVDLNKKLNVSECTEIFNEVSYGLVDTQIEKLYKLAEGLEYDSANQFKDKLTLLKESYFGQAAPTSMNVLNEFEDTDLGNDEKNTKKYMTPDMRQYSRYMDRQAKHNNY